MFRRVGDLMTFDVITFVIDNFVVWFLIPQIYPCPAIFVVATSVI